MVSMKYPSYCIYCHQQIVAKYLLQSNAYRFGHSTCRHCGQLKDEPDSL